MNGDAVALLKFSIRNPRQVTFLGVTVRPCWSFIIFTRGNMDLALLAINFLEWFWYETWPNCELGLSVGLSLFFQTV